MAVARYEKVLAACKCPVNFVITQHMPKDLNGTVIGLNKRVKHIFISAYHDDGDMSEDMVKGHELGHIIVENMGYCSIKHAQINFNSDAIKKEVLNADVPDDIKSQILSDKYFEGFLGGLSDKFGAYVNRSENAFSHFALNNILHNKYGYDIPNEQYSYLLERLIENGPVLSDIVSNSIFGSSKNTSLFFARLNSAGKLIRHMEVFLYADTELRTKVIDMMSAATRELFLALMNTIGMNFTKEQMLEEGFLKKFYTPKKYDEIRSKAWDFFGNNAIFTFKVLTSYELDLHYQKRGVEKMNSSDTHTLLSALDDFVRIASIDVKDDIKTVLRRLGITNPNNDYITIQQMMDIAKEDESNAALCYLSELIKIEL